MVIKINYLLNYFTYTLIVIYVTENLKYVVVRICRSILVPEIHYNVIFLSFRQFVLVVFTYNELGQQKDHHFGMQILEGNYLR